MRITANRLELFSAVRIADEIAPSNSPLESLKCAHLTAADGRLTVAATNLEISIERNIPAEVGDDGDIIINAKLLSDMLRMLGGDTVTIAEQDKGIVTVTSDTASYNLSVLDTKDYPHIEIPFPEDTVPVTGLPAMAKRTVFAASDDANDTSVLKRCVHLSFTSDGLRAASTDGYRIASAKGDSKITGTVDFLVMASALEKLSKLVTDKDELKVGLTGKNVVFMKDDFVFSARLIDGRFFDMDALMANIRGRFTLLTDAKVMQDMLDSVCTVKGRQNRFSITFTGPAVKMTCESEYGVYSCEQECGARSGNPTGTYWFNPDKLYECVRAQSGTMMLEVAQNGAVILKTNELTCVQMATREPKPIDRTPKEPKPVKDKKEPKTTKKKKTAEKKLPAAA